ncbi:MAG: class I SAM-dependent methyltransferase [Planctomycetota bacterium]
MLALLNRVFDRARWEWREWRHPSLPPFVHEELDHALLDEIAWQPGERVLDIGCAYGAYLQALSARSVLPIGTDIDLVALQRASATGRPVTAADAQFLPFRDDAFDTLLCHKTLHLFGRIEQVISEFGRVLRPGGRIVFSSSNLSSPYARVHAAAIGDRRNRNWAKVNCLSAEQWCRAFRRHGFHVRATYSCNLVWPLVFRVRDTWLLPNEWMRRYSRWIRRFTRTPLRTARPIGAAMDFVIEMVKPNHGMRRVGRPRPTFARTSPKCYQPEAQARAKSHRRPKPIAPGGSQGSHLWMAARTEVPGSSTAH